MKKIFFHYATLLTAAFWVTSCELFQPALHNTDSFKLAYELTLALDAYDDYLPDAELIRKAVLEKFNNCPFTPEAKKQFEQWRSVTKAKYEARLAAGTLPDCSDFHPNAESKELHNLLIPYSRGEVSVDEVFPGPCDFQTVSS